MQLGRAMARRLRVAVLVIVLSLLLTLAAVLLIFRWGSVSLPEKSWRIPTLRQMADAALKRAANLSLALLAAALILFAGVVTQAGALKAKLHWAARASGAFVVAAIISYFAQYAMLAIGPFDFPVWPFSRGR